ncbi:uncharacterized protein [Oryza sativa Japonica Group]|uniref:Os05g0274300 protein n=4 Tax=Oryza TaxID=4527 RepID=A0A0N7KKF9_ORYSJ|nr:uncharacterized protein LOC4338272 [Oryza sativa Japonica Group]AAT85121.1 unknown protein [Oryza sativa Japonica Group]EEE63067.1 hypothetical protein OsJ_17875 [Oryza sativa Japonica Group]KAF2929953.1 hypothetical protein DAI22_05g094300 [Oryza sativa Japonica Group]BAF16985.1 Os05g0274300 [Oryza sativa Japonica Group]BAS93105.1 Os05g0274300 [Oryza sativa Japonica Group]|eukprot:NP_001055071.1 Os05g0274300 [Oryza sativa Japonica Group]
MGGGGDLSPSSAPSSPSSSSEPLPHEFAEYAAVSPAIDGESDGCCVCDDPEVEAFLHGGRLQDRSLREAKELIRRYKPGDLVEGVCGTKSGDYVLPDITTFLLVGPRDAGKSALVNRITRVFDKDDDPDAPDRAQVSCNSKSTGTSFLREYRVPRNSNSICIYDTRSLSNNHENNFKMLQRWMTKGLSHGDIITWDNDNYSKIQNIKSMGRQYSFLRCKTRKVNFVIFVVNGASVLESIENNNKNYIDMLHKTFMYPFLSFGDDKPAVVVTHGDRLTAQQRMHVRNELVELLGIPLQQIFDISGCDDYETDLSVLDMLRYCIQHAEQNFPIKKNYLLEMHGRETLKQIAVGLMGFDAVIETAIIFLCIVILLLRVSDKLVQW